MTDTPKCPCGFTLDACVDCTHPVGPRKPVPPDDLDFAAAIRKALRVHGPLCPPGACDACDAFAALSAQHLAALEGVRKEERRKGFISGYVDRCKHRHFETTGFTCFASEVDAFEAEAVERWERLRALEARMEAE